MFTKRSIVFTVIALAVSSTAFAQGEFLRPGESGFGVAPQFFFGNEIKGKGISGGISIEGKVDLTFSYAGFDDPDANSYSPAVTLYFKNSQPEKLLGVALSAGFIRTDARRETSHLFVSMGVFGNYYIGDDVLIQPAVNGMVNFAVDDSYDRTSSCLAGGLTFCFAHRKPFRPFIGTGVVVSSEDAGQSNHGFATFGFVTAW